MRPHRDSVLRRRMAGLAIITGLIISQEAIASEGGTGHYLPGAVATMIDLAPTQPGWVVEPIDLYVWRSAPLCANADHGPGQPEWQIFAGFNMQFKN